MKTRVLTAAVVLFTCASAFAARTVSRTFQSDQQFPLEANGTLILDNPAGNVIITAKDTPDIEATIYKRVDGTDLDAVEEGRRQTMLVVGGNPKVRTLRMTIAPGSVKDWQALVAWNIRLPRGASVRVLTTSGDHIRISGLRGAVQAKNFNGQIIIEDVVGPAIAESVNGSIFFIAPAMRGNVLLSTVNGDVTVTLPRDSGFRWIAETVKGDIRTHFPARGAFIGNTFNATANAPGGPTLRTASVMGNVYVYGGGMPVRTAVSVRAAVPTPAPPIKPVPQAHRIVGDFTFATNLGDVRVQEVTGKVDISTGGGEVQIGAAGGAAKVRTRGGPVQLGEIYGVIDASTRAGDILVDTARRGGAIQTAGGTIRLLYTSGPTRLYSGGGDIHVRQAAAPVEATTESGDIAITVDASSRTQKVTANTAKGNVVLTVSPQFGADFEATIITSNPDVDTILSDIPGLSISRDDEPGGKTRVHATGKLNGGGEKVVLLATDGDIRISTGPAAPTVVMRR
ncbi:MAG TPA: DUF4097 family beta strand repeat-containing protein [Thermoanaerobaculia bacterium]|jgi:DUF4097 and DUF4098 domain-containing protein YvlB|nr:DUF4097 family beta strand repeat-containing protein [Thermoanaerobaculia bacterium]